MSELDAAIVKFQRADKDYDDAVDAEAAARAAFDRAERTTVERQRVSNDARRELIEVIKRSNLPDA